MTVTVADNVLPPGVAASAVLFIAERRSNRRRVGWLCTQGWGVTAAEAIRSDK